MESPSALFSGIRLKAFRIFCLLGGHGFIFGVPWNQKELHPVRRVVFDGVPDTIAIHINRTYADHTDFQ